MTDIVFLGSASIDAADFGSFLIKPNRPQGHVVVLLSKKNPRESFVVFESKQVVDCMDFIDRATAVLLARKDKAATAELLRFVRNYFKAKDAAAADAEKEHGSCAHDLFSFIISQSEKEKKDAPDSTQEPKAAPAQESSSETYKNSE